MATVNLNHVQFWAPPPKPLLHKQHTASSHSTSKYICTTSSRNGPVPLHNQTDRISKRNNQLTSIITSTQHQGDNSTAGGQDHNNDLTSRDDKTDDDFLLFEDLLDQISHKGISTGGYQNPEDTIQHLEEPTLDTNGCCLSPTKSRLADNIDDSQGTRDSPVVLEDDEPHNSHADSETASSLTTEQAAPPRREAWWDVENRRWVDDNQRLLLSIEQEGLAGSTHINLHDKGENLQDTSDDPTLCLGSILSGVCGGGNELAPQSLPEPLDENGDDSSSDLERDLLLALEEQEKSVSADTPSSPAHHRPIRPLQNQGSYYLQAETTRIRTEEPRDASQVKTLDEGEKETLVAQQEAEGEGEGQQHEREKDVVRLIEDIETQQPQQHREGSVLEEEDEELDELAMEDYPRRWEQEDVVDNSEDEDYSCDTSDEDEEGFQPVKRQRLPSPSNSKVLQGHGKYKSKPIVRKPLRTSSTATQRHNAQPKTMHIQNRTSTVDEQLYTPQPSRSPSTVAELELAAEYQEWPLHGFLKSTRIGNDTTFNLEFHLVDVPEYLDLSAPFRAFYNNDQSSIKPRIPHSTTAHSMTHTFKSTPPRKRAPWTLEEDATLVKMKEQDHCPWEEISAALPSHSLGSIQVRYSTKFSKLNSGGTRSSKRQRPI